MTHANLSFARPGWVSFTALDGRVRERRPLDQPAPFSAWSLAYQAAAGDPAAVRGIGLAVGQWLDGTQQWLTRWVREAPAPLILEIEVSMHPDAIEQAVLEAPWELIACIDPRGTPASGTGGGPARPTPAEVTALGTAVADQARASLLALDPQLLLCPVRRIGPAGAQAAPSAFRPRVVFMAAQPDGQRQLDIEREEADIVRAAGGIGLDLYVEDSGTLAHLDDLLARLAPVDVLHVTCHGTMGPPPALLLEDDDGRRLDARADDLARALAGRAPALTFLSACMTAQASPLVPPLVIELCQRGWPAVIGWSAPVTDTGAIVFAAELYRAIACRLPLVDALAHARATFARSARGQEWHKPRLYLGPRAGGKVVDGTRPRDLRPLHDPEYLDGDTLRIPVRGPFERFGHRRVVQRTLAALRGTSYAGAAIVGGDEIERATFARRVSRRMPDLREVVVAWALDAEAILDGLRAQVPSADVARIVDAHLDAIRADPRALAIALREILEGPCARQGSGAVLLVMYGMESSLVDAIDAPAPAQPRVVDAEHLPAARGLLRGFSGAATESRLLFASAAPFAVPDEQGHDLAANLAWETLDPPGPPSTP